MAACDPSVYIRPDVQLRIHAHTYTWLHTILGIILGLSYAPRGYHASLGLDAWYPRCAYDTRGYHGGYISSGTGGYHYADDHRGMQGWDVKHPTLQVDSCTSLYWHVLGEYGTEGDMSKWDVASQELLS